jgi:hypothetical protein
MCSQGQQPRPAAPQPPQPSLHPVPLQRLPQRGNRHPQWTAAVGHRGLLCHTFPRGRRQRYRQRQRRCSPHGGKAVSMALCLSCHNVRHQLRLLQPKRGLHLIDLTLHVPCSGLVLPRLPFPLSPLAPNPCSSPAPPPQCLRTVTPTPSMPPSMTPANSTDSTPLANRRRWCRGGRPPSMQVQPTGGTRRRTKPFGTWAAPAILCF